MNRVKLINGVVEITEVGEQTKETIENLTKQAAKLSAHQKPVLILVDVAKVTKTTIGARIAAKKVADELPFEKMAFVGASVFLSTVVSLILKASKQPRVISFFKTREEAMAWLKS